MKVKESHTMPPRPRSALHARLGHRVRSFRLRRGLTQSELAEQVGCSNHFVSGIERGVDSPSLLTLERIAEALDTSLSTLLEEEGRPVSDEVKELSTLLQERSDRRLINAIRELIVLYVPGRGGSPPRPGS